ncbi:STAS domain-containing protein [Streptomyces sp. NPDC006638]|uniref:STAS domain-containing protein n=1 Tax=unclassified Streptomyces TaxID=2593676 RepID=UPI0033BE127C
MTDRTLTATRRPHPAGATVLAVTGELDHHTARELSHVVDEAPFTSDAPVIIDLTDLTYCDSTGLTVLVAAYNRAQQAGTPLVLVGLNADLTRVFRIVGLDQLFSFQPTLDDAVAALRA